MIRKAILSVLPLVFCGAAFAQTTPSVDELVNKNIAARGGVEKLKAIQSVKVTGKGIAMNGLELPMTVVLKRPGLMRTELSLQGRMIVQAFDGTDSWSINPMTGSDEPQKAAADESKQARNRAESTFDGFLMDYKSKGIKVELVGKEDVEGAPAYKLKLTTKDGDVIYNYLDVGTYLDVKTTANVKQMGQEMEVDSYPSDYKSVNGVMMAHTIDQRVGGNSVMKLVMDKVETNVPIDDAVFKFPAKPAAKPEDKKQ